MTVHMYLQIYSLHLSLWTFHEFRRITNRTTIMNALPDDIKPIRIAVET
jgi:hypothetical protein